MRLVIVGGTGLVGRPLANGAAAEGHDVTVVSRRAAPIEGLDSRVAVVPWDGRTSAGWADRLDGADAVVNLAGENLGGANLARILLQRWTESQKRRILESRQFAGRAIVEAVRAARTKPGMLLQMSAVGYYGPHGDEDLDESSPPADDFLARVCLEWEGATEAVEELGVRRVVGRTGLVLSRNGQLFQVILLPFRLFVGGPIGRGAQGFSWIHAEDQQRALRFLIENGTTRGAYNLTAPAPVSNAQLGKTIASALHRPYWFPTPAFLLRWVLGEKATLVVDGQRVVPRRLLEAGFEFRFPSLASALDDLVR